MPTKNRQTDDQKPADASNANTTTNTNTPGSVVSSEQATEFVNDSNADSFHELGSRTSCSRD